MEVAEGGGGGASERHSPRMSSDGGTVACSRQDSQLHQPNASDQFLRVRGNVFDRQIQTSEQRSNIKQIKANIKSIAIIKLSLKTVKNRTFSNITTNIE